MDGGNEVELGRGTTYTVAPGVTGEILVKLVLGENNLAVGSGVTVGSGGGGGGGGTSNYLYGVNDPMQEIGSYSTDRISIIPSSQDNWLQISTNGQRYYMLKDSGNGVTGTLWTVGYNYPTPTQVGTDTWKYIKERCGIKADGTLWCQDPNTEVYEQWSNFSDYKSLGRELQYRNIEIYMLYEMTTMMDLEHYGIYIRHTIILLNKMRLEFYRLVMIVIGAK